MTQDDFIGLVRKAAEDWANWEGISATNMLLGIQVRDGQVEVKIIN